MIFDTVKETLGQLKSVIEQMHPDEYAFLLPLLSHNSVGKHTRHILEFYQCLFSTEDGIVDYDARQRNILLETDPQNAIDCIENILKKMEKNRLQRLLELRVSYQESVLIPTSYEREMVYNIEHTIHHLAIIKIALQENFPYLKLPENFGVAYSTVKHLAQVSQ